MEKGMVKNGVEFGGADDIQPEHKLSPHNSLPNEIVRGS